MGTASLYPLKQETLAAIIAATPPVDQGAVQLLPDVKRFFKSPSNLALLLTLANNVNNKIRDGRLDLVAVQNAFRRFDVSWENIEALKTQITTNLTIMQVATDEGEDRSNAAVITPDVFRSAGASSDSVSSTPTLPPSIVMGQTTIRKAAEILAQDLLNLFGALLAINFSGVSQSPVFFTTLVKSIVYQKGWQEIFALVNSAYMEHERYLRVTNSHWEIQSDSKNAKIMTITIHFEEMEPLPDLSTISYDEYSKLAPSAAPLPSSEERRRALLDSREFVNSTSALANNQNLESDPAKSITISISESEDENGVIKIDKVEVPLYYFFLRIDLENFFKTAEPTRKNFDEILSTLFLLDKNGALASPLVQTEEGEPKKFPPFFTKLFQSENALKLKQFLSVASTSQEALFFKLVVSNQAKQELVGLTIKDKQQSVPVLTASQKRKLEYLAAHPGSQERAEAHRVTHLTTYATPLMTTDLPAHLLHFLLCVPPIPTNAERLIEAVEYLCSANRAHETGSALDAAEHEILASLYDILFGTAQKILTRWIEKNPTIKEKCIQIFLKRSSSAQKTEALLKLADLYSRGPEDGAIKQAFLNISDSMKNKISPQDIIVLAKAARESNLIQDLFRRHAYLRNNLPKSIQTELLAAINNNNNPDLFPSIAVTPEAEEVYKRFLDAKAKNLSDSLIQDLTANLDYIMARVIKENPSLFVGQMWALLDANSDCNRYWKSIFEYPLKDSLSKNPRFLPKVLNILKKYNSREAHEVTLDLVTNKKFLIGYYEQLSHSINNQNAPTESTSLNQNQQLIKNIEKYLQGDSSFTDHPPAEGWERYLSDNITAVMAYIRTNRPELSEIKLATLMKICAKTIPEYLKIFTLDYKSFFNSKYNYKDIFKKSNLSFLPGLLKTLLECTYSQKSEEASKIFNYLTAHTAFAHNDLLYLYAKKTGKSELTINLEAGRNFSISIKDDSRFREGQLLHPYHSAPAAGERPIMTSKQSFADKQYRSDPGFGLVLVCGGEMLHTPPSSPDFQNRTATGISTPQNLLLLRRSGSPLHHTKALPHSSSAEDLQEETAPLMPHPIAAGFHRRGRGY